MNENYLKITKVEDGRIVIPKKIRQALNLSNGCTIIQHKNHIEVKPGDANATDKTGRFFINNENLKLIFGDEYKQWNYDVNYEKYKVLLFFNGKSLIITKESNRICNICNSIDNLISFHGNFVCRDCIDSIKNGI